MNTSNQYNVVGAMSGTSLDGLDLAFCEFKKKDGQWSFQIKKAKTIPYPEILKQQLAAATKLPALEFCLLHTQYGQYTGKAIKEFLHTIPEKIDFVASHGHTTFHQPENKMSVQIGCGASIAAHCKQKVICDFRTTDCALGGQGAPLVPIGDQLLFSEYTYCLNLGGFANISYQTDKRIAFDICPANIYCNQLMEKNGKPYDENGETGKSGTVNTRLLKELNQLDFYKQTSPKSLGTEWLNSQFIPIIEKFDISVADKLSTMYEHIALQTGKILSNNAGDQVLVTGGGAHNSFLIERIKANTQNTIIVPNKLIVDYKEALIFAFLGVLRHRNETNCLASVTGAKYDNVGGAIYWGKTDV